MKTILCSIPQRTDATSFYRGVGWLQHHKDYHYKILDGLDWSICSEGDVILLQRPYNDAHVKMAAMAKDNGLKVWVDWDDHLYTVSPYNPHYPHYEHAKENLDFLQETADMVTVSTPHLHAMLSIAKNVKVVPNILPRRFHEMYRKAPKQNSDMVFWRGGKSHDEDWYAHAEALSKVKWGDTRLVLLGAPPAFIRKVIPKAEIMSGLDIVQFMKKIHELAPKINIVPLADSTFNKCKSNISWLETAWIGGAVSVAPDYDEWHRPGIINYKDSEHFAATLQEMLKMPQSRLSGLSEEARYWIDENQSWKSVTEKREEVLKCLTED